MDWYYANGAQQTGPVSDNEMRRLAAEGVIAPFTMVWHERLAGWQTWVSVARPAGTFVYGGFWLRWLAYAIDAGIIGTIRALVVLPLGFPLFGQSFDSPWLFARVGEAQLSSVVIGLCYFVFFWTQYGATPGKLVLRLKVVTPQGGPISVSQAVGRYFGQILSGLILGIGFLMAAFDDEKRALHDRLCDTRVIRVN